MRILYSAYIKRAIDIILSFLGILILSPIFLITIIAVKIDDPSPAFFKHKILGLHKTYFSLYKFGSMKVDTPDIPTHLLTNPEQYISRVGAFLRKTGLDEFPQMWNIFKGDMSIIGPCPALWNQDDLIAVRDKYGANDVHPGLTGWAQINGRDQFEIPDKAKFDGEYVKKLSFRLDCKCFIETIFSVLKSEGVVEGCIGNLQEKEKEMADV